MADPISVLGAAASNAGLVYVLSRCSSVIGELRGQWKDADFTFVNLTSQLLVLKVGLTKVREWTEMGVDEAHHQLVMDLDSVILCCKALVDKLDAQLQGLRRNQDGQLSRMGKMKLVLGGRNMDEIQKMIERQTNTLTLLLTVCNR